MLSRTDWYAVQLLHDVTSFQSFSLGIHASMSYFFAATIPISPVQMLTTLNGSLSAWKISSAFCCSSSWNFQESSGLQMIICSIFVNWCTLKSPLVSSPWLPTSRR